MTLNNIHLRITAHLEGILKTFIKKAILTSIQLFLNIDPLNLKW